jgi:type I restriction enzyme S subunit
VPEAKTKPLSEFCEPGRSICYGIVQPGTHDDTGVPIVRVNNFRGNHLDLNEIMKVAPIIEQKFKRSRPKPNDVLISLVGSLGQVAIAPPTITGWNLARAVGLIPTNDPHHAQWIYFALQTREAQQFIQSRANTTVQATFNLGDLAALLIPYPERKEREAVLSVLSSLDNKIELNQRTNETLEATAQAIFKDWFIDFGPVRRKLEGTTDPVAIMGGLTQDAALAIELTTLFPDSFGDDGLPEGWQGGTLGEYALNFDSKRVPVSGSERAKRRGPYPYHGATGVMDHVDDYLFDGIYLLVGEDGSVVKESGLAFMATAYRQQAASRCPSQARARSR